MNLSNNFVKITNWGKYPKDRYENSLLRPISVKLRRCDFRIQLVWGFFEAIWTLNYAVESNQCLLFRTSFDLQQINEIYFGNIWCKKFIQSQSVTLFHASLINFQNIEQVHFMTFEGLVLKHDWRVGGLTFIQLKSGPTSVVVWG